MRVRDKPDPAIEHPDDAILAVTRAAICGSDLHLYHGLVPDTRVGTTFGHEFTGVVEEVGPGGREPAARRPAGRALQHLVRHLLLLPARAARRLRGIEPLSDLASGVFGYSHTTGGYDGGQAEYVRVPFADVGPMKIPDDLDDEDVLLLTDVLPTGYQAAEMGGIDEGRHRRGVRLRAGRARRGALRVAPRRGPRHRASIASRRACAFAERWAGARDDRPRASVTTRSPR